MINDLDTELVKVCYSDVSVIQVLVIQIPTVFANGVKDYRFLPSLIDLSELWLSILACRVPSYSHAVLMANLNDHFQYWKFLLGLVERNKERKRKGLLLSNKTFDYNSVNNRSTVAQMNQWMNEWNIYFSLANTIIMRKAFEW